MSDFDDKKTDFTRRKERLGTIGQQLFEIGKLPPQAVDLEQAVLGSLMMDKESLLSLTGMLAPESFYKEAHIRIYGAIQRLFKRSAPVDILTVTQELKATEELDIVGGAHYISTLTNRIGSAGNAEYWAFIILQQQIRRGQIRAGTEMIKEAYDDGADIFDTMANAHSSIQKLEDLGMSKRQGDSVSDLATDSVSRYYIREKASKNNIITGIPSGITSLDKFTGGWQEPDLIILAARPGMGKTAKMIKNVLEAAKAGFPVAVFSLEISAPQMMDRMILSESGVDANKFKFGKLSEEEKVLIEQAKKIIATLPIYIDDTAGISPEYLRSKCGQLYREKGIRMFALDYLQLMQSATYIKGRPREQEISSFSSACKNICKTLKICAIVLSQLSRAVETRGGDKKPQLSDLRESGAIEQDADLVLFIHRAEYYGMTEDDAGNSTAGKMEVIIAKHRNGAVSGPADIVCDVNPSLTSIKDAGDLHVFKSNPNLFIEARKEFNPDDIF